MDKQEYKHIRNLSWDLLIDAHISCLPVDITKIAQLYNFDSILNASKNRYENALILSKNVLNYYGYNSNPCSVKLLTTRILAPMIVLKAINITSAYDISKVTELPIEISKQRYKRYEMLLKRNAFCTSNLEVKVLSQFQTWINNSVLG